MDKHTHDDSFVQPNTTTSSYDVADWLANRSTLDAGPNFNILDTAANIAGAFNKLDNDDHITQIIISDNAPITLTVTKLSADTDALSKLIDANGNPATVTIKDTAAHIGTGFATIGASDQVTSIVVSDNAAVTLTASQVANNQGAVGELINANSTAAHVTVFDTAANIPDLLYILSDFLSTITSIVV